MTRAEQAALKAYPNDERKVFHSAFGTLEIDKNAPYREGYVQGYKQSERDTIERACAFIAKYAPNGTDSQSILVQEFCKSMEE